MLLKSIITHLRRRRNVNKIVQELSQLSDRTLDDIGVSRKHIRRIAKSTVYS